MQEYQMMSIIEEEKIERVIKELEDIKNKIQNMPNANPSYWNKCDVVDIYDVLELLEDRIKELNNE